MKSYTDLEQSRKLAEILPIESADGFWGYHDKWYSEGDEWEGYEDYPRAEPYLEYTRKENEWKEDKSDIPCWSLAALLDVLPTIDDEFEPQLHRSLDRYRCTYEGEEDSSGLWRVADNPVDACIAMIEKLYELNLL